MIRSIIRTVTREKARTQSTEAACAAAKGRFQDFLDGEGRLPDGFSAPWSSGTPFDPYLAQIKPEGGRLIDVSGISLWLRLDAAQDVNAAARAICRWADLHRQARQALSSQSRAIYKKYHVPFDLSSVLPPSPDCGGIVMTVTDDAAIRDDLTEETVRLCKAASVCFCSLLSDHALFDLTERREKQITLKTGLGTFDDACVAWTLH